MRNYSTDMRYMLYLSICTAIAYMEHLRMLHTRLIIAFRRMDMDMGGGSYNYTCTFSTLCSKTFQDGQEKHTGP